MYKNGHRNGKTALSKIEDHEKLCRLMQRETFKRIDQLYQRIERLERVIMTAAAVVIAAMGGIIITLLNAVIK
jgi:hypothetical protein